MYVATDVGNEGIYYSTSPGTWVKITPGLNVHSYWGGGTAPTAAAGANSGTGPPAPVVVAGSNDERGTITFGTGTGPAAGSQVVVTFAAAYGAAPFVFLTPTNGQTYNIGMFVLAAVAASFTIGAAATPAASQVNTVYSVNYVVVG